MKKLVKVLALVLALALAMAPATEAQAATKTLTAKAVTETDWLKYGINVEKTGSYKVKIKKTTKRTRAGSWIVFKAPKAGVYQIKMSNLHSAKDKNDGLLTDMDVFTKTVDKDYCVADRTCYFVGLKDYNSITLCGKKYYEFCQSISKKQYKNFVKNTTINCKLKKGDHLIISLDNFQGVDALDTIDTFAFDMKITKK